MEKNATHREKVRRRPDIIREGWPMRRKDREAGTEELLKILQECRVCRVAMTDRTQPYVRFP
jgi:hypothetical protein